MVRSMTGFGAGRAETALGSLSIEIRTVNNRFFDLQMRLPGDFSEFEGEVRQALQRRIQRGKITLAARFTPIPGATSRYSLNHPLLEMLESACRERGQAPPLTDLLCIDGVVLSEANDSAQDERRDMVTKAVEGALDGLVAERTREGEALRAAIAEMHAGMVVCLNSIKPASGEVVAKYRQRLKERMDDLLGPQGAALDPGRLEQEVALFADKADINEEIVRLEVHLKRLAELLADKKDASKGRPLDFLSQELLREVNTIGSKCRDLDITNDVLELKNLVESMKEQVANIE